MKKNKVNIFIIALVTLIIIITTIFLFNKISFGANLSIDTSEHTYWDGSVSSSLTGSGTEASPYLIRNGGDLEYFLTHSISADKYLKVQNDIYLNRGSFDYDKTTNMVLYYLNGVKYYINNNKYYSDPLFQNEIGTLNTVSTKATCSRLTIDGDYHKIVGLFTANSKLINNFKSSTMKNISFLNCVITGSSPQVGLISNLQNVSGSGASTVENIAFNGIIKNNGSTSLFSRSVSTPANNKITISNNSSSFSDYLYTYSHNIISGTASKSFKYNGSTYAAGSFSLRCVVSPSQATTITVTPATSGQNVTFSNLTNTLHAYDDYTGLFVGDKHDTTSDLHIERVTVNGYIYGHNIVGGILAKAGDETHTDFKTYIYDASNFATLCGSGTLGGIVGSANKSDVYLTNVYNAGELDSSANNKGALVGQAIQTVHIENCFNTSQNNIIGIKRTYGNIVFNDYCLTTKSDDPEIDNIKFHRVALSSILSSNMIQYTLNFSNYNDGGYWIINNGEYPRLFFEDYTPPAVTATYEDNTWDETSHVRTLNKIFVQTQTHRQDSVKVNTSDNDDIAKVEYYIDNTVRTTSLDINSINGNLTVRLENIHTDEESYIDSDGEFYIGLEENSVNTIYIKVTDISGNVSWLCTDTILYIFIELIPTKGVSHQSINSYYNTDYYLFDEENFDQINLRFKANYEVNTFPFNSNSQLYFTLDNNAGDYIPANSIVALYDHKTDNIYELQITDNYNNNNVIVSGDKEYYRLSDFSKVGDSSVKFDGSVYNKYSNSKIEFDFEIILYSPPSRYIRIGNNIAIISGNDIIELLNTASSGFHFGSGYGMATNFTLSGYSSTYNANNIDATINYSLNFSPINSDLSSSDVNNHFYDLRSYIIKAELVKNNATVSNTAPCNLKYYVNSNTYTCKTNGITYIPVGTSSSGTISIQTASSSPSYLDITNGSYIIKFTAYNKYNNDLFSTTTIPLAINTAKPINDITFENSIPRGERFIISSGVNELGNTNFHVYSKYTGTLTSAKRYIRIYKISTSSGAETDIIPSTLFSNASTSTTTTYNNKNYYYVDNLTAGTRKTKTFTNSSMTEGRYIIEVALFANNKFITSEQFNFVVSQ